MNRPVKGEMIETESSEKFNAPTVRSERPTSRHGMVTSFGVIGGVAIVALLLTAASAAAAPVLSARTHSAPYTGQANQAAFWSTQGCGTGFDLKKLPEFNLSKGTFAGSEVSTARSCGTTTSSLFGEIEGSFSSNEFNVSNGTYTVSAHWKILDTIVLAATSGAGGITAGSYVVVGAYAELDDVTSGTSWQFGNASAYYGNSTSASSQNYSYPLNFSAKFHLVAGQAYELVTGVYVEVNAFASGAKSTASAAANIGTAGKKASLTSVGYP
jgi:hypothetical protein